ncbi:MAG: hypothetical protein J6Y28_09835 [Acholeplasmatales bacterium]|nr:hypothetical protein [Methanobrevibacter sp.]MBP5446459.1 hypothetical protein [Acholeplasmatales bacterium]
MTKNKTKVTRLPTRVYTAQVKLNPKDKFKKLLILENDNGTLFVDGEFFVISFLPGQTIPVVVKDRVQHNFIFL